MRVYHIIVKVSKNIDVSKAKKQQNLVTLAHKWICLLLLPKGVEAFGKRTIIISKSNGNKQH